MFKSLELNKAKRNVDTLFEMIPVENPNYFEINSHWARYLSVCVSGFMEEALEVILVDYITNSASPIVLNYAQNHISRERKNPNTTKIKSILDSFDNNWGKEFEEFAEQDGRKDALDGVMSIRHLVAHGRNNDTTIHRVKTYYEKCLEIVSYLESLVNE